MLNSKSIAVLKPFLDAQTHENSVTIDHVIGFMSGLLACSEFFGEAELAQYISDDHDAVFNQLMTDTPEREALIDLLDSITDAQVAQSNLLAALYPHEQSAKSPSEELQNWCSGYLAAYLINQEVWQLDFDFLLSLEDSEEQNSKEEGQQFVDNFEASLNLLATFAMWPEAHKEHPEPETLSDGFTLLYTSLDESLTVIASMALMLEDEKLEQWEEEG